MNPFVKLCIAVYRRLARAFPHEFWMIYGEDLEQLGEEAAPEIWRRHGFFGLIRFLADTAIRLPMEYLAEFRQDAVYAIRTLVQAPGVTAVAVISLTIGIGLCVTFFTQVEWMAETVPVFGEPEALVATETPVSYPQFERYRDQAGLAESTMAFAGPVPFAISTAASTTEPQSERVFGHLVSPEYFLTLRVTPAAGRFFHPDTEKIGSDPVVVISDRFWRRHLDSDPRAIGRTLRVNGHNAVIVGIGPKDFLGVWPVNSVDIFVPVSVGDVMAPELAGNALANPRQEIFRVVFRTAPEKHPSTEAAVNTLTQSFDRETGLIKAREKGRALRLIMAGGVMPLTVEQRGSAFAASIILGALVLMLACGNLANLVLARGRDRRKEIAIRLSVGASRLRLVRQLLAESLMMSLAASIGSLMFAHLLLSFFIKLAAGMNSQLPTELGYHVNFSSAVFAAVIAVTAGVGFGLVPAFASTRADLATALKEGAATSLSGHRRLGVRNLFVGAQVAASLMLLLLTSYLVIGYQKTSRLDPGFDIRGVYLFQVDPARNGYTVAQAQDLLEKLPGRLARAGSLTFAEAIPLADLTAVPNTRITVPKAEGETEQALASVVRRRIGVRYFGTLGIAIIRGREFSERDMREGTASAATAMPIVVNQTAARELFGNGEPIGRIVEEGSQKYSVVGVVSDTKQALILSTPLPTIYVPIGLAPEVTAILRGTNPEAISTVRNELAAIDSRLSVFNARTMEEWLEQMNGLIQISSIFYLAVGLFGLILASIGLAGVTAYAVVRRRKEIGIRIAMGARRRHVLHLVLKEGITLVFFGSVLGFAAAYGMSHALAATTETLSRSFAVGTDDPRIAIGVPLIVAAVAMAACYIPARRSTRIVPIEALRDE